MSEDPAPIKEETPVYLRLYDISNGKVATWSQIVLRRKIEGIWHTGIHVFGFEYFYGGGINCMTSSQVESTFQMEIVETRLLGYTTRSRSDFEGYFLQLYDKFTPETYDLVKWNCNHFSDTCAKYLLNKGIPDEILNLPQIVSSTFIGHVALKVFQRVTQGNNPCVFSPDDPNHPRHEFFPAHSNTDKMSPKSNKENRADKLQISSNKPDNGESDSSDTSGGDKGSSDRTPSKKCGIRNSSDNNSNNGFNDSDNSTLVPLSSDRQSPTSSPHSSYYRLAGSSSPRAHHIRSHQYILQSEHRHYSSDMSRSGEKLKDIPLHSRRLETDQFRSGKRQERRQSIQPTFPESRPERQSNIHSAKVNRLIETTETFKPRDYRSTLMPVAPHKPPLHIPSLKFNLSQMEKIKRQSKAESHRPFLSNTEHKSQENHTLQKNEEWRVPATQSSRYPRRSSVVVEMTKVPPTAQKTRRSSTYQSMNTASSLRNTQDNIDKPDKPPLPRAMLSDSSRRYTSLNKVQDVDACKLNSTHAYLNQFQRVPHRQTSMTKNNENASIDIIKRNASHSPTQSKTESKKLLESKQKTASYEWESFDLFSNPNVLRNSLKKYIHCPECGTSSVNSDLMCRVCGYDFMLMDPVASH